MFFVHSKRFHVSNGISSIEEKNNAVFVGVQCIKLIHVIG